MGFMVAVSAPQEQRQASMSEQPKETSEYSSEEFTRFSAGLSGLAAKIQNGLIQRFGIVSMPERAPYGVYGYVVLGACGQILAADSPVHGQVVPICFRDGQHAQSLAAQHGGRASYGFTYGVDAARYCGLARFGNRGPVALKFPISIEELEQNTDREV